MWLLGSVLLTDRHNMAQQRSILQVRPRKQGAQTT
jgi:hypothetical protein